MELTTNSLIVDLFKLALGEADGVGLGVGEGMGEGTMMGGNGVWV